MVEVTCLSRGVFGYCCRVQRTVTELYLRSIPISKNGPLDSLILETDYIPDTSELCLSQSGKPDAKNRQLPMHPRFHIIGSARYAAVTVLSKRLEY